MTLSIIIPAYNREASIADTLESIFRQRGHNLDYEVIVVDDASADRTAAICRHIAAEHPQLHVLNGQHAGPGGARNMGLAHARGTYIWFIDSDDFAEEGAFAVFQKEMTQGYDAIAFCSANLIHGEKVRRTSYRDMAGQVVTGSQFLSNIIDCSLLRLKSRFSPAVMTFLFKRDFLLSQQLSMLPYIYHEDLEFTPRVLMAAQKVLVLDDILYLVYPTPGSIVRSINQKKGYDNLTVVRHLYDYVQKDPSEYDRKLYIIMSIAFCNSLEEIWKAKAHHEKKYIEDLRTNSTVYRRVLVRSRYGKYLLMALVLRVAPSLLVPLYNRYLKNLRLRR